ncbi:MAG: hypothetical protein AAB858_03200 [Patescibacteria group bacterium]
MFQMKLPTTNYQLPTTQGGFTLIETLVATFVLVTAIVGPLTITAKGVFFSNLAKSQITAFYLAQEPIEYIRNKRDNNTIAGGKWADFKSGVVQNCMESVNPNGCYLDVTTDTISQCGASGCPYLNRNSVSGFYGYETGGNWSQSEFRRTVKISNVPASNESANEIFIVVEMTWQNGILTKNFVLKENLFDWQ